MVTHGEAKRGPSWSSLTPRQRHTMSWLAALVVPSAICALIVWLLDPYLGVGGESALFFIGVLVVALLGGVAPAALSAVLSGLLLNYFLVEPRHTFTIAEPDSAITIVVLLAVAVAVAALVDGAAKRAREATQASREAELLALFAGSVLRGADLEALLERVRETYSQRAVSMLRVIDGEERIVACVGNDPCVTVDSADTAIEVGDDEFWMLMAGKQLAARDRRVLTAVAKQAAGLVKQRELSEEAGKAEAIAQADELRRSLLSAVSHDLRTPLAAAKAAVSSLRSDDVDFSAEDTAELLATIEESIDQLTALVGNLLDSSRLAAGVVAPNAAPRLPGRDGAAGAGGNQQALHRFSQCRTRQGEGGGRRRGRHGRQRTARAGARQPDRQRPALRAGQPGAGHGEHGRRPGADRRDR